MALQVTAGEALNSYITLLDVGNSPILGETWTVVLTRDPEGSSFALSVAEVGNGVYQMIGSTAVGDPPGEWFALVEGNTTGRQFSETWDVSARAPTQTVVQTNPAGGLSLRELRRQVAADLGDLYLFTATQDTNATSVKDAVTFARQVHHFRGMEVTFTEGTVANVGLSRVVQDSDGVAQTVTFSPNLPDIVHEGDEGELHDYRSDGWTFSEKNEAINAAIARAGEQHASVPITQDTTDPFDASEPFFDIPLAFSHFAGLYFEDRDGIEKMMPVLHWTVDVYEAKVWIRERFRSRYDGKPMRMIGRSRPAPLTEDTHTTPIPSEWIVAEAKALLLESDLTASMTQGNRDRLLNMNRTGADARRPLIVNRGLPNTVRIR